VRLLAKYLRRATALVHEEPRFYKTTKLRPDLDVVFAEDYLMVDVVVHILPLPLESQGIL